MNAVIMQRRPDLRFSLRAIFFFPLYRAMSMMFRLFAHLRFLLGAHNWANPTILERTMNQKDLPPTITKFVIRQLESRAAMRAAEGSFHPKPGGSSQPDSQGVTWNTLWGDKEDAKQLHRRGAKSFVAVRTDDSTDDSAGRAPTVTLVTSGGNE